MGVSKNDGTPKSSPILGYHYFWKHSYCNLQLCCNPLWQFPLLTHVNPPVTKMEWIPQFTARIQKSGANDKVTNLRFEDSLMSSSKINYLAIQESFKLSALDGMNWNSSMEFDFDELFDV